MRPKKPRFCPLSGIQLADNLYPDPKKRPGIYLYVRPDGSKKLFHAASVGHANVAAEEANTRRERYESKGRAIPSSSTVLYHADRYVLYEEKINPRKKENRAWKNRCADFRSFAKEFETLRSLDHNSIRAWWDGLTFHAQKNRQAAFRRMFNWFMQEGLTPKLSYNPFNNSADSPKLLVKQAAIKKRKQLTPETFDTIRARAADLGYECLQIAMSISRYTTLREGDICRLRWDSNIKDGHLRVIVGKSEAQKGTVRAARLSWRLEDHPILKSQIDRARELSLINKRCPYVISHKPRQKRMGKVKQHDHQVLPNRLSNMFTEAMRAAGVDGTSFHEVRGLSSTLYRKAGYENQEIMDVMAHESIVTTMGYQNPDELPYHPVTMRLSD